MNKIICEVCGTAYQETATQCPICGCVRTTKVDDTITDNTSESTARTYAHVKGGRFSKANVKKRNRANQSNESGSTVAATPTRRTPPKKKKSNAGLVIAVIILLLAIVAVVVFLAIKYFANVAPPANEQTEPSTTEQTETTPNIIPCEELTLDVTEVRFEKIGDVLMIYAEAMPSNTTDAIQYISSDPNVATVTEKGKVEAVGPGEAEIVVTCGEKSVRCNVVCEVEEPTEETTEASLEEVIVSAEEVWLNRKDMTLSSNGEKWVIYSGGLKTEDLQWMSNNDSVASIENGTVKATGSGMTTVHVVYTEEEITGTKSIVINLREGADEELWKVTCTDEEGNELIGTITDGKATFGNLDPTKSYDVSVKVSCIVRCSFSNADYEGVGGHGGAGADGEG